MEAQSSAWKTRETTQLVHKMQNPSSVIILGSIRPYSMAKLHITVQMMIFFFFSLKALLILARSCQTKFYTYSIGYRNKAAWVVNWSAWQTGLSGRERVKQVDVKTGVSHPRVLTIANYKFNTVFQWFVNHLYPESDIVSFQNHYLIKIMSFGIVTVAWPRSPMIATKHWLMYLLLISLSASCFSWWWMTRRLCSKLERCSSMITQPVIGLPLHLINALALALHKYADSHQALSTLNRVHFLWAFCNHWGKNLVNEKSR